MIAGVAGATVDEGAAVGEAGDPSLEGLAKAAVGIPAATDGLGLAAPSFVVAGLIATQPVRTSSGATP